MTQTVHNLPGVLVPGQASPRTLSEQTYAYGASVLECEVAAIKAVFQVEAAGKFFNRDGTIVRRFEPHKFGVVGGKSWTWRQSLKLSTSLRRKYFVESAEKDLSKALAASSWGAPQIMGFNYAAAGFPTPVAMVEAFSKDAISQFMAFVRLVRARGWDTYIRSHDWHGFARKYNGPGQAEIYAQRIAAAYESHAGERSARLLRLGVEGNDVAALQEELIEAGYRVTVDGHFGPETERAVKDMQRDHGLKVDGIVGAKTRKYLAVKPEVQKDIKDTATEAAAGLGAVTGVVTAIGSLGEVAQIVLVAVIALGVCAAAYHFWRNRNGVA